MGTYQHNADGTSTPIPANITIVEVQSLPLPEGYYWSRSNAGNWEIYSHDVEDSGPYPLMIRDGKIMMVC